MRLVPAWSVLMLPLLVACSGGSSENNPSNDAGSDAADAPSEAGPCAPQGAWVLTLSSEVGQPKQEQIVIDADPDAGPDAYQVIFSDRTVPADACSYPDAGADAGADAAPPAQTAAATLDPQTCTLSIGFTNSWCYSGEQQCQDFHVSLTLNGSTGTGSASDKGGWCMDQHTQSWDATASRITK